MNYQPIFLRSFLALLTIAAITAHASAPPTFSPAFKAGVEFPGSSPPGKPGAMPAFSEPAAGIDLSGSASRSVSPLKAISTLYTRQVTTSVQHEVESSITALTIGGVDHTIGAYMNNFDSSGHPNTTSNWEIRTRKSTNLTTWTQRIPTKPAGATQTVDPVLAANVYTSGISPLTVYLGGLGTDTGSSSTRTIAVWRSTDGGNTWSAPVTVAQSNSGSLAVDKPAIAVSWRSSTRGYVFVAYVLVRTSFGNRSQNELFVARSTDGGVTFSNPVQVAQSYLHAPQVIVSSATGNVYVVYVDYDRNKIRMATSTNQGNTWTIEDVTGPSGKFLDVWDDPDISGGSTCNLQAITVPHARFNWVRGSIGIVWHERGKSRLSLDGKSGNTDVWFIAKTASGWTKRKRVNTIQARDQWMPALDFDSTGKYVVVYYDRSADPNNLHFETAWAQIDPLYPMPSIVASGLVKNAFASDPTVFNQTFPPTPTQCFKGEYQDIWYWPYTDASGGRFNSFWTGTTSPTVYDNVYLSGLK